MNKCSNEAVKHIMMRAQFNTIGPIGKNVAYVKVCPLVDQGRNADLMEARISQIRELIRLRDGFDQLEVLNQDELQEILLYVCVS